MKRGAAGARFMRVELTETITDSLPAGDEASGKLPVFIPAGMVGIVSGVADDGKTVDVEWHEAFVGSEVQDKFDYPVSSKLLRYVAR